METRTLTLAKAAHKYVFRYRVGAEEEIVDEIMRLAESPACNLDWLDAALLGFEVAQQAANCHVTQVAPVRKCK
ncbi:MAG: hypothetical protein ACYTF6_01210 [Planctomycetota bacterium]